MLACFICFKINKKERLSHPFASSAKDILANKQAPKPLNPVETQVRHDKSIMISIYLSYQTIIQLRLQ